MLFIDSIGRLTARQLTREQCLSYSANVTASLSYSAKLNETDIKNDPDHGWRLLSRSKGLRDLSSRSDLVHMVQWMSWMRVQHDERWREAGEADAR